jgi:hypothetical protein
MFELANQTRKLKKIGNRHTVKKNKYQQIGGYANWYSIQDAVRQPIWNQVLPDDLKFVCQNLYKLNGTPPAPDIVKKYIEILERQDELFECAMYAIYMELGIIPDKTLTMEKIVEDKEDDIIAIDPNNVTPHLEYIEDVAKLIYFTQLPNPGGANKTKIQQIVLVDNKIEFLLNPLRVQNMFMKDLAVICILQKKDPTILSKLTTDALKDLRAARYGASIEVDAYQTTGKRSRDGFFARQLVHDFRTICGVDRTGGADSFWQIFVRKCNESTTVTNAFFGGAHRDTHYGILAAYVYQLYNANTNINILKEQVLDSLCRKDVSRRFDHPRVIASPYLPDWLELDNELYDGMSLKKVYCTIDPEQLEFIVHLIYLIKKLEPTIT